jgi:hypothetical protein
VEEEWEVWVACLAEHWAGADIFKNGNMYWILQLLVNAGVLFLLAGVMTDVKVRSYGTAIVVALVIGLLNATVGFLLRLAIFFYSFAGNRHCYKNNRKIFLRL